MGGVGAGSRSRERAAVDHPLCCQRGSRLYPPSLRPLCGSRARACSPVPPLPVVDWTEPLSLDDVDPQTLVDLLRLGCTFNLDDTLGLVPPDGVDPVSPMDPASKLGRVDPVSLFDPASDLYDNSLDLAPLANLDDPIHAILALLRGSRLDYRL
jgi:hypothetical protein